MDDSDEDARRARWRRIGSWCFGALGVSGAVTILGFQDRLPAAVSATVFVALLVAIPVYGLVNERLAPVAITRAMDTGRVPDGVDAGWLRDAMQTMRWGTGASTAWSSAGALLVLVGIALVVVGGRIAGFAPLALCLGLFLVAAGLQLRRRRRRADRVLAQLDT